MNKSLQAKIARESHMPSARPACHAGQEASFTDHSVHGVTLQRFFQTAQHSPQAAQLRQFQQSIENSPHATAQRQQLNMMSTPTAQRQAMETAPLQGKFDAISAAQLKGEEPKPNRTGMPNPLKSGIESLSGMSMDKVRVHYNSAKPAQLNALAYAQGTNIHMAPGQEKHLPHEAWHVVQQAQGRVKPTMQMKGGVPINDDTSLEHEADVIGARASQLHAMADVSVQTVSSPMSAAQCFVGGGVLQRKSDQEVKNAAAECNADNVEAVKLYSQGWKKKSNLSRIQILNSVRDHQGNWAAVRDHVMQGGGGAPPTGYHSKALGDLATSVGVGATNPAHIGQKTVYKQWTKQRGQLANNKLKISTFFPESWDETKIKACVLLSFGPVAHQMTDQLALDSPGGATFYPNSTLADPPQPA